VLRYSPTGFLGHRPAFFKQTGRSTKPMLLGEKNGPVIAGRCLQPEFQPPATSASWRGFERPWERVGRVLFKKAEMTVSRKGMVRNIYKVKLDTSGDRRHIDLIGVTGLDEGKTLRGIYKLDGDCLTLCAGTQERPTTFKTQAGSTLRLTTLQRTKS
jgi:uncharacterized protein (TIGR03067 family)